MAVRKRRIVTAAMALTVMASLPYAQPRVAAWQGTRTPPPTTQKPPTTTTKAVTAPAKPPAKATTKPTQTRARLARAQAAARARQAALIRQQQELVPHFKSDALGNLVPDVSGRAAAAIIYDPVTKQVLWESNSREERSIASLTKLMTAVTFIADDPDLDQQVLVTRADMRNASVTYLRTNDKISYRDLLHLLLIASDNAAARVLARTSEGGSAAFIARMNDMAGHLKLPNTRYTDPSGLDAKNVSSAYDLAHIIDFAASDDRLGPIMRRAEFEVHTSSRAFIVHSTNKMLGSDVAENVVGGKTGFISKAGYCLATLLQLPQGAQVAVVVLGAANSAVRFSEARHLFNWIMARTLGIGGVSPN